MAHLHEASLSSMVRYLPVWVYLFVYVLTCLIAATVFYFDYRPVVALVEYFSGAIIPKYYILKEAMVLWALLLGAPLLFTLGFFVSKQIRISADLPFLQKVAGSSDHTVPPWVPMLFFVTAASFGAYDLIRAGAFAKLLVWSDYGAWVEARWAIFSTLGYFNFVNLYLILPVSAAWLILGVQGNGWKTHVKRVIPLVIVVALTLLLFQKKALIVSLIIIFLAVILHRIFSKKWTTFDKFLSIAAGAFIVAVYFALVVVPVYSETSRTASKALVEDQVKPETSETESKALVKGQVKHETTGTESKALVKEQDRILELAKSVTSIIGSKREAHIFTYAMLAPMTRTSLPAMHYPIVFPSQHDYYGLDFGQDIMGFGGMPDDNLVIWKNMYPNLPGAAGAPYQFALYSQVGVIWALILCSIVGFMLGMIWQIILADGISSVWRSLMGSMLILFSIYLAIDSIRGSLLASYGVIWAWLFISLQFFLLNSLLRSKKA